MTAIIIKLIKTFQKLSVCVSVLLTSLLIVSPLSNAADTTSSSVSLIEMSSEAETILVPLYKSRIVLLHQPLKRISIGNTEIADVLILRSNQLYILGKDLGTTNVLLWDTKDKLIASLNIEVSHDLRSLKEKLHELLPNEEIEVHSSQGALVLSGQVSSLAVMDIAMQIASSFAALAGGIEEQASLGATATNRRDLTVVNLMGVGGSHQVMLKVTVAEMSTTVVRKMGFKFNAIGIGDNKWTLGGVNGGATFPDAFDAAGLRIPVFGDLSGSATPIGPVVDEFAPNDLSIENTGLFASFLSDNFLFNAVLEASKDNGTARILAEPTLTTLSGQEAKFLSGGEFPIPVPDEDGIGIEFKEFGIGLKFLPVVLESGRINLKLNISVSELVAANNVVITSGGTVGAQASSAFFVPALTKRDAISTVELADGQTIGIAGLISENMRDFVTKFPGLGDIPVLGHLFRSSEFQKGETELVILVTPQLVKPFNRDEITLPTDSYVEPNDIDFYLLGRNRGRAMTVSDEEVSGEAMAEQEGVEAVQESTDADYADQPLPTTGTTGGVEESFGHSLEGN